MKKLITYSQIVAKLLADLDEAEAHLSATAPSITGIDKARTSKMRKGGTQVVASIASLAKTHGVQTNTLQADTMSARIEAANALEPLEQRLERMLTRIRNERFVANSAAWGMALKFYSLLQRCAADDNTLATNLAPIESFFAFRHETEPGAKQTKAQTRAKAKLANAQQLIATANARAVVRAQPVAATPVPAPIATPVSAPSVPSLIVTAPSNVNGVSNGAVNGASNGASYGAQSLNGGH